MTPPRATVALLLLPALLQAGESVDLEMMTRLRDEGFNRSQVMETAATLTDVIGPRLTGSPAQRRASEWARQKLSEWGLSNARLETWGTFGRGWSFERAVVSLEAPEKAPLLALPKGWTPGTNGQKRGRAVKASLESEADREKWKGQLRGAVLLMAEPRELKTRPKEVRRYSEAQLEELEQFPVPEKRSERAREEARKRHETARLLNRWLADEGVLAVVEPSQRDGGTLRVMGGAGGTRFSGAAVGVPTLVMAATQYNRIVRLLDAKTEVELAVEVAAS
ncbi:MAG TPA: peptidase, partial [Vicinamibacteria bacterium]